MIAKLERSLEKRSTRVLLYVGMKHQSMTILTMFWLLQYKTAIKNTIISTSLKYKYARECSIGFLHHSFLRFDQETLCFLGSGPNENDVL